ncbi:6-phospho-beta-glucosidase [Spiroplasma clarkii]|uniref:6-phospho-beta-glucosidase n=1 Tax=Spiroplasma clarkii TaxID=2139 RepID=A0A1Y0L101_9MOLU|nr:glycoside hydrolase family 1 protein [Spiroplasma clarkii]ARU91684.1 6-phospho-beta-glucosidase [Spiroplasma clarkii]ATX71074.1 6-phospho-beta-glucosidase [Spiroplasma clarkii]
MKLKFDKDFWFGAATSGPQSEGTLDKPNQSIYDYWYETEPSAFWNQVGPTVTCNTYQTYASDVEDLEKLGLNSFRTSVQWSRLFDDVEKLTVSEKNLKFYRNYFKLLKAKNIKFVLNLFHFDLPQVLMAKGGWENEEVVHLYAQYARKCFELFGDLVDYFTTFNEPVVVPEAQYLMGLHYPYHKDFQKFMQVSHHIVLAHCLAVQEFKKYFKTDQSKKIAIILNLTPSYPKNDASENVQAAQLRELLFNRFYLDVVTRGAYPQELLDFLQAQNCMFNYTKAHQEILTQGIVDFLGVNYYQPARIQAPLGENQNLPWKWFEHYDWPERKINPHRGWEIYPRALYDIALTLRDEYNNIPWYLSENGMGVEGEEKFMDATGVIIDDYRIEFYQEHLYWLHKAILAGANCFGFHAWTFIDCWSWANAFKNRYGYISLDLQTGKRTIKKSGQWIKQVCATKTIEIDQDYE